MVVFFAPIFAEHTKVGVQVVKFWCVFSFFAFLFAELYKKKKKSTRKSQDTKQTMYNGCSIFTNEQHYTMMSSKL